MPISTTIVDLIDQVSSEGINSSVVRPVQFTSGWATVIDAAGINTADASGSVTDPDTDIVSSTTHLFRSHGMGTLLCLRVGYDNTHTAWTTAPVLRVFGRRDSSDEWMLLSNNAGATDVTFSAVVAATGDSDDGTLGYTTVNNDDHIWDMKGCKEFLVGVVTAFAEASGDEALAIVQAKMF